MRTVGIICEYNPFHLGHGRQLRLIREKTGHDTAIICVMSGNYVQRGMPAMWDKYTRARAAVAGGADVVLELPLTRVLQSAEGFADGGVEVLSRFGGIEFLSFGAECGDGSILMELAGEMDSSHFTNRFQEGLASGLSYAAAKQAALGSQGHLLTLPNNILGVEYCRAILKHRSSLQPLVIQRNGDYHALEADVAAPSATAVRNLYPDGDWARYVPSVCRAVLSGAAWYDLSFGERAVLARLRSLTDEQWEKCAHGGEGLWSKAMKAARSQPDLESVFQNIKSKRYPRTRIQRLILCAYLGITEEDLRKDIPYARILAFSAKGRGLLREAKDRGILPLVNPGERPADSAYYAMEIMASDLFSLFAAPGCSMFCEMEQKSRVQKYL